MTLIDVRSRSKSYGILACTLGLMVCMIDRPTIVCPSGGDLAAISVPVMVLPPARLSTTTCCPQSSVSLVPTVRPIKSLMAPGVKGMMRRTGRVGKAPASLRVCAPAAALTAMRVKVAIVVVIDCIVFPVAMKHVK